MQGASFDLETLHAILPWNMQTYFVDYFREIATGVADVASIDVSHACFALFRCYLNGFGVIVDAKQACYWLTRAAEEGHVIAGASLWGCHEVLQCPLTMGTEE